MYIFRRNNKKKIFGGTYFFDFIDFTDWFIYLSQFTRVASEDFGSSEFMQSSETPRVYCG